MNDLGVALQQTFIWKGKKVKKNKKFVQTSEKMVDMSPERLKECWNHCEKMLHNDDPKFLGRCNVLDEIVSQINKCNVELLVRYFENTYQIRENVLSTKRFSLMLTLKKLMENNPDISDWSTVLISRITEVPDEFENVSIEDLLKACTKTLGTFDKKHVTLTFITKMGLWFSKAEELEFKTANNSNVERLKLAKERLHLPEKPSLSLSSTGLSFHEMRAMLILPNKQQYYDMSTEQLLTLRDKVLLRLLMEVNSHIKNWNILKRQLELVAKEKNITLHD